MTKKQQQVDIEDAIEDMTEEAVICRDLSHSWRNHDARRIKGGFERVLRCNVCGTTRNETLDSRGGLVSRYYSYPDGYTVKGLGRITGGTKDFVRMTSLLRLVNTKKVKKE